MRRWVKCEKAVSLFMYVFYKQVLTLIMVTTAISPYLKDLW